MKCTPESPLLEDRVSVALHSPDAGDRRACLVCLASLGDGGWWVNLGPNDIGELPSDAFVFIIDYVS